MTLRETILKVLADGWDLGCDDILADALVLAIQELEQGTEEPIVEMCPCGYATGPWWHCLECGLAIKSIHGRAHDKRVADTIGKLVDQWLN